MVVVVLVLVVAVVVAVAVGCVVVVVVEPWCVASREGELAMTADVFGSSLDERQRKSNAGAVDWHSRCFFRVL